MTNWHHAKYSYLQLRCVGGGVLMVGWGKPDPLIYKVSNIDTHISRINTPSAYKIPYICRPFLEIVSGLRNIWNHWWPKNTPWPPQSLLMAIRCRNCGDKLWYRICINVSCAIQDPLSSLSSSRTRRHAIRYDMIYNDPIVDVWWIYMSHAIRN